MSHASDLVERFLAECTVASFGDRVLTAELHMAYADWARSKGLQPLDPTPFSREMIWLGNRKIKSNKNWWRDRILVDREARAADEALEVAWSAVSSEAKLVFLLAKVRALGLSKSFVFQRRAPPRRPAKRRLRPRNSPAR